LRTTQIMKLIVEFSRASYYFICCRTKYSPQHALLKHFQLILQWIILMKIRGHAVV
jgi:hypothetical protein